ncbi:MAG: hypothetical protein H6Q67_1789 [Firmicutes bacterium]|nr:hypothetical protein [Bacillota bacterium]
MKVTFEITLKDFCKQRYWARWNVPFYRNINILYCLILLALFSQDIYERVNIIASILFILVIIAIYVLCSFILDGIQIFIEMFITNKGYICVHNVEISTDGFREQTELNDSLSRWKGIKFIKMNKEYIYYGIGRGFIGIPRRAFATEIEADQFLQKSLTLWQEDRENKD